MEDAHTGRHLLALGLVAMLGVIGLVVMFNEVDLTGQATKLQVNRVSMTGCTDGELMLTARGVEALKQRGREIYGPDFSPYHDAGISYNGVGYCADAGVVRALFE